jgi:hypothetical protein
MLTPATLPKRLSKAQAADVNRWWRNLGSDEQRELRRSGRRPPVRVVARLVEPGEVSEPADDFYEYLVNHEIYIDDGPKYHICLAHPDARAAVAAGHIPAGFRCPRGEKECPMRTLLDLCPGWDVRLSLVRDRCP